jgi:hypothetical protein
MDRHGQPRDGSVGASLKATYRALLARGLETGEAANLTAFLHGLPSNGFHWTLPEIEAVIQQRIRLAADQRALATASPRTPARVRSTVRDRRVRGIRGGSTHVIDPPTP